MVTILSSTRSPDGKCALLKQQVADEVRHIWPGWTSLQETPLQVGISASSCTAQAVPWQFVLPVAATVWHNILGIFTVLQKNVCKLLPLSAYKACRLPETLVVIFQL
jgi:hypothetical protein